MFAQPKSTGLTKTGKIVLILFGIFVLGAVTLLILDSAFKPKPKQESPEVRARKVFASRINDKWDLPGVGFIGGASTGGQDEKTLSIMVSSDVSRSAEPAWNKWLNDEERKEAIRLGFNKIEITHGDWSTSEYDLR